MKDNFTNTNCPSCGFHQLKNWSELSFEEKILAEKLPESAGYSSSERKQHLYCTRCWYVKVDVLLLDV